MPEFLGSSSCAVTPGTLTRCACTHTFLSVGQALDRLCWARRPRSGRVLGSPVSARILFYQCSQNPALISDL